MGKYVGAAGLATLYRGAAGPARYVGAVARDAWDALGSSAPIATPDTAETYVGAPAISIYALANDTNADEITAASADVGSVTIGSAPDYLLRYTPPASGPATVATITYTASGPGGPSDTTVTVDVYDAFADTGAAEDVFDEAAGTGTIDIFEDDEPNLITGGVAPYTVEKDSGDAELTIVGGSTPAAQHAISVDLTAPGDYSITFTATDALGQTIQITHDVSVLDFIALTVQDDRVLLQVLNEDPITYVIPEGEPYAGTYTIIPGNVEASAPTLLGDGGEEDVARPYFSGGTLFPGLYESDADASQALSFSMDYRGSSGVQLDSGEIYTAPSGTSYVDVTASDQYGTITTRAYVQVDLTADSPQTWVSSTDADPATFDASAFFSGGSGPKAYTIQSDATGAVTISGSTLSITGGAASGNVVVRATDSLTPTSQTADLTVTVDRTADAAVFTGTTTTAGITITELAAIPATPTGSTDFDGITITG